MIKILDLTVYELLGYLLPGSVAFLGFLLVFGIVEPSWLERSLWAGMGWFVLLPLAVSYVLGHVIQALANKVFGVRFEDKSLQSTIGDLPDSAFEAIARRLQMPTSASSIAEWRTSKQRPFLSLCTEILDQDGKPAVREVYLYREGFYRGTSIALVVLALGFVARGLAQMRLHWGSAPAHPCLHSRQAVFALISAIGCVCSGLAFRARYRRFVGYRIGSCILGAIVVASSVKPNAPQADSD
jgi:hypothetical protein